MTEQEYTNRVNQMWADWAKNEKQKFPNLLATEHNSRVILSAANSFFNSAGMLPETKTLSAIIRDLGDIESGGRLQYHHASQVAVVEPENHALNLPHSDEPLLKNIRCLEDLRSTHGLALIDKIRMLGGGAGGVDNFGRSRLGSSLRDKYNTRIAYIQKHNITLGDLIDAGLDPKVPDPEPSKPKPIYSVSPDVAQAHALVDAMTLADIGTVTSNVGRREALAKKKERLHKDVQDMRANGESAKVVLQKIKEAIRKSGEGGIS